MGEFVRSRPAGQDANQDFAGLTLDSSIPQNRSSRPPRDEEPAGDQLLRVPSSVTLWTTRRKSLEREIPAQVVMLSGYDQSTARITDIVSYGVPNKTFVPGATGAGGPCTRAMQSLKEASGANAFSWRDLLLHMQRSWEEKTFDQRPQINASYQLHMDEMVQLKPPTLPSARTKALLIGINYLDSKQGTLFESHYDVETWKKMLLEEGFDAERITVMKDDGMSTSPTKENIQKAMINLVSDAQPGDCLVLQFSGHGSNVTNPHKPDRVDHVLFPIDHHENGMIWDDWILDSVVMALPARARLFCAFDCVHSGGTIIDLPYVVTGTPRVARQLENTQGSMLQPNSKFKRAQHKLAVLAEKAEVEAAAAAEAAEGLSRAGSFRTGSFRASSFRGGAPARIDTDPGEGEESGGVGAPASASGRLQRASSGSPAAQKSPLKRMAGSFRRAASLFGSRKTEAPPDPSAEVSPAQGREVNL